MTVVALATAFVPWVPNISIDGHVLLSVVLPPLLYSAALDVSFVSFRRSMPQIRRLGIGLVVVTTVVVGLVAWWLMPALTLPGALLLGAIVAPPDAVSAASIGRKLGLPRRVMTVLSGESLINDATSLTLFRVFTAIIAGAAAFHLGETIWQFVVAVFMGVAVGLVFGVALHQLRMRLDDPVVNGTFGLLAPFGAYGIAEQLDGSGVLAVVSMGLYVGFNAPRTSYTTRMQETPLWLSAEFLLASFVFAYIGLQLPQVVDDLRDSDVGPVIGLSLVVLLTVLLVRPLFVYPANAWGQWALKRQLRSWEKAEEALRGLPVAKKVRRMRAPLNSDQMRAQLAETKLSWRENAVVSWAGMRGVVTLATALAAADLAGLDEQAERAIVVVAFVVTIGTLLLQGLTLPWLIRRLGVVDDAEARQAARELAAVRQRSREAGKAYLREMRLEWVKERGEDTLPAFDAVALRLVRVESDAESAKLEAQGRPTTDELAAMSRGWLAVRRQLLLDERDAGNLSEEVMHELIDAMDAEELALDTSVATRISGA